MLLEEVTGAVDVGPVVLLLAVVLVEVWELAEIVGVDDLELGLEVEDALECVDEAMVRDWEVDELGDVNNLELVLTEECDVAELDSADDVELVLKVEDTLESVLVVLISFVLLSEDAGLGLVDVWVDDGALEEALGDVDASFEVVDDEELLLIGAIDLDELLDVVVVVVEDVEAGTSAAAIASLLADKLKVLTACEEDVVGVPLFDEVVPLEAATLLPDDDAPEVVVASLVSAAVLVFMALFPGI